jgi:hypothetical protein
VRYDIYIHIYMSLGAKGLRMSGTVPPYLRASVGLHDVQRDSCFIRSVVTVARVAYEMYTTLVAVVVCCGEVLFWFHCSAGRADLFR